MSSRQYLSSARDAFVELIKEQALSELARAAAMSASNSVHVCHIHDEALMRLRSQLPNLPEHIRRARYSKVQNNVVRVFVDRVEFNVFCELQALERKDKQSIGLALLQVVQPLLVTLAQAGNKGEPKGLRFIHLLTGDAIPTNLAAAKIILEELRKVARQSPGHVRYFLLMWVCASHQANLVVQIGIVGRLVKNPQEQDDIVANCSRLYKHLMPAHAENYAANLLAYLEESMRLEFGPPVQGSGRDLQRLYGEEVLPQALFEVFNKDLGERVHLCLPGTDRAHIVQSAFRVLSTCCLLVQERPVVTRFFLFTQCVWGLLRMVLLRLPVEIFSLSPARIWEQTSLRTKRFQAFYASADAGARLRRASLCLQLTWIAVSLSSKTKDPTEPSQLPLLVRLGQGEVQSQTSKKFLELVPLLHYDPLLDGSSALEALLVTQSHIVCRFEKYLHFPTALWKLCADYAPTSYVASCECFLETDDRYLDAGYSLQLKRDAVDKGSFADQLAWLVSPTVQQEISEILRRASASSLDVERKHATDKKSENNKMTTLARASRNSILAKFRLQKHRYNKERRGKCKIWQKHLYANKRSLAIQRQRDWLPRPRGRLRWEGPVPKEEQARLQHAGSPEALRTFIATHDEALTQEARELRQQAQQELRAERLSALPYSNEEWLSWLDNEANEARLRKHLREATGCRRVVNSRLVPSRDLPSCGRLQPAVDSTLPGTWGRLLLQQQHGWFSFNMAGVPRLVIWFVHCGRLARGISCLHVRGPTFVLHFTKPFWKSFQPIDTLLEERGLELSTEWELTQLQVSLGCISPPKKNKQTARDEACANRHHGPSLGFS